MTDSCIVERGTSVTAATATGIPPILLAQFATVAGIIVLPLYAAQPLVAPIAATFNLRGYATGFVAMVFLLGYAAGLLLLVPLTDILEIRRSILATLIAGAGALILTSLAPSAVPFFLSALAVGIATSAIQMLVPVTASFVPEAQRGRVIGTVMSGLMIGVLLSRPIASLSGGFFGWRGAFAVDAIAFGTAFIVLYRILPYRRPGACEGYAAVVASLWGLLRTEAVLRRRSLYQALCMGAFGVFWTGVALRLAQPPFDLGPTGIALFALAGAGGAVIAPIAGWAGDRGWSRRATRLAHGMVVVASALAGIAGAGWLGFDTGARPRLSLSLLAVAAVALDLGVIGDQTLGRRAVNLTGATVRGRANGLYTGLFFLGGAVGSALSGTAVGRSGWTWICLISASFGATALGLALNDRDA